ncbi:E3 ubiquitin-protein ligase NRDP1-like [Adelges cooleyi]|uniref:E3 ubiquitin-protein ligase NRDP1-like n=1 Tax=Adelges cooleyi TaxID=133065 RepID=UPI0021805483|nr:E3 ubiquitin-protein ligase NRDP1-like [Adelges cooleyi]XP_050434230.1 E3 ubiquitin-protein ligase NRDP1-like [Adelges cooleyi]
MIWKIIILLLCFNVLVNTSSSPSASSSGCLPLGPCVNILNAIAINKPPKLKYSRTEDWIASLKIQEITDWTNLIMEPTEEQIKKTKKRLESSGCPSGASGVISMNSQFCNWPNHIKNTRQDNYDINALKNLTCRRIPEKPILYVGNSDNRSVAIPGIVFTFASLEPYVEPASTSRPTIE